MSLRRMILRSAIWIPTVAIAGALAHGAGLFAKNGFVYQYQTLIGAIIAVAAAAIAAVPVWRQLDRMAAQTNIALRETLSDRLRGVTRRKGRHVDVLLRLENELRDQISIMIDSESDEVEPEWAFQNEQGTARTLARFREIRAEWRDSAGIAAAMDAVEAALLRLQQTLDPIHRPHSLHPDDEDHNFTAEQWAGIEQAAVAARAALLDVSTAFDRSILDLGAAFDSEMDSLRDRLRDIDNALIRDRS